MSFSCLSRVATLALLPLLSLAAMAQQAQQAGPADPRASVPVPVYVSAFSSYRPAADAPATPDRAWRAANEAAANNDPHARHMPMPDAALQGELELGYANKNRTGAPRQNGYEVELSLPLFDWGSARRARADAIYMQAVQRTADTAIRARSEVRAAYSAYRTRYDIARHYVDEVVPLRKRISDEVLLRYNGMLASVFELLTDSRAQVGSVNAAIEAQRDFWIAQTNLQAAINGSGTGGASTEIRGQAYAETQPQH